ncbi:hypothetical protein [Novosphingobium sp. FSW06-99]|uniref:hypothetical protein n=1 Tax=Novosphingobium sp. FSW06-99 TaxID=1739113 RepID=UPI00076C1833|nr:hypothetical protein [Novosphingobium sp. FSW06-99]KUR79448.1 hypothetical protein AQZ49_05875 [Novosphingobium sp. FSW06-99]
MKLTRILALYALSWIPLTAVAQTAQAPTYQKGNQVTTADGIFVVDKNGNPFGTSGNPLNTFDSNTATVAAAINAPLNAQVTHAVLVGAVEGATAVGTSSAYPLTIQGNASGVAVPISGAPTVATGTNGAVSLIQGASTVAISATTSGTVQLVALASGKSIYVTHVHVITATSAGFALVYGTGTNCGSGTTYLDGANGNTMAFTANSGYSAGVGLGPVYVVPSGNALCAVFSTAANYAGSLTYSQF